MDVAGEIKQRLSMGDVARHYGFTPNGGGFIACPLHREKTPSLKIYEEPGRGFHCYGCGKGGSVIDFTMELFGLPFAAAVVRLNADFRLGLCNDHPDPRELRRLAEERLVVKREAGAREAEYMAHTREHCRLWQAKLLKAPANPDEPFDAEYVEACQRLPALEEWFRLHPYKRGEHYQ